MRADRAVLILGLAVAGCAAPSARVEKPLMRAPESRITQEPVARDFAFEGAIMQGGVVVGTVPAGATALALDGQNVPIAPDGRFLIAFDRDAPAQMRLIATLADGTREVKVLTVSPRAWQIERIDAPLRPVNDSAAFMTLREPELKQIEAARAISNDSIGWRQRFIWPARGRISGRFGSQRIYRGQPGSYHGGVDIALPTGAELVSPADGVVVLATDAPFTLEGRLLIIDHGMGLNSAFLHLSRIDVKLGDHVAKGQRIGAVGATGRATGPHMHWGMKWNAARIDPMLLAGPSAE